MAGEIGAHKDGIRSASDKPVLLIADDSRIVRATLMKHVQHMFEFREAPDGEDAWEQLLRDPDIQLVITDLTMPRLDGYGLLQRMRASPMRRLKEMPVVVVSGSDDPEERERARACGATDLITKGMPTEQLVSRLDILAQLVRSQDQFERAESGDFHAATQSLTSPYVFHSEAEAMLRHTVRHRQDFTLLCLALAATGGDMPESVLEAVSLALKRTIRQTDTLARTGATEFTITTASLDAQASRGFGDRLCRLAVQVGAETDQSLGLIASCGVVSVEEFPGGRAVLHDLWDLARRRCLVGLGKSRSGAVGATEELALKSNAT
ncbi:response regulator [Noviherbaspirillum pedocola]|uniref:Response regulator n=1 Tax=Noviherbaspirillum pedocola TaxID=2801341 RepID=A0A934W6X9_9BURK|nr:response regulator [Noviherbaspirillum pedocola]MBK4734049.1 response regulator [Noviherbaspirillum pedocola]